MKSRPYRLGQRQLSVEQTRARIVAAARELLGAPDASSGFSLDAVAAGAGVSRMTVFNQFGSKRGLLEALFDDLAARGLVTRLRAAFMQPDPREALGELVAAFGAFWNSDRIVFRRIRALAALDADFGLAVAARDERRREGLRAILTRLAAQQGKRPPSAHDEVIDVLHTLTSFETFDHLAGANQNPVDVVPLVRRLTHAALQLGDGPSGGGPVPAKSRRRRCR